MISYTELSNSTYLDYNSYRSTADAPTGGTPLSQFTFNVALVLAPVNDPTALLNSAWAARQTQIAAMTANNTLWSTYGADSATYTKVLNDLPALGVQTVEQAGSPANQYISSQQSSTIWVQVNQDNFTSLFGPDATLMIKADGTVYWSGNLSLPADWISSTGVQGIEFDTGLFGSKAPTSGGGAQAVLPQGPQSIGNSTNLFNNVLPQDIAANNYNVPLTGLLWDPTSPTVVQTAPIGVLEPQNGTALPGPVSFQDALNAYLVHDAGITGANVAVTAVANGGQVAAKNGERSLDVSIISAVDPLSDLYVYAGSGTANQAQSDAYTAYQSAFWDPNNPQVISSSYGLNAEQPAAGSPFLFADRLLFTDAALRNITVVTADSDGGSGDQFGNGVTNVETGQTSPYDLMVGGTSLSTVATANADPTLGSLYSLAMRNDPATLWRLIAGGLTTLPSAANATSQLVETVWNEYYLDGTAFKSGDDYLGNNASTGGVDTTQPVPSYQTAFGLTPTTADTAQLVGRGAPDVAALSGGNMWWKTLNAGMDGLSAEGGTSASTPFWAALITQINAVFKDQGMGQLGYMNDLLYIADVIAPGSFNDVTLGNNTSSYLPGGPITDAGSQITPTGYGYSAGPGYDLTTGLGSPNGLLLARALATIAHTQTNALATSTNPNMLDQNAAGGWTSTANQSLLFQTMSSTAVNVSLFTGSSSQSFASTASSSYAWTSQMADQVLQPGFDPNLVTLFDKQSQGALTQSSVSSGDNVAVSVNGATTYATQGTLSTAYGFADFDSSTGNSAVRVALPVAVAQTAGNADNQDAVVRIRQNGQDSLSLEFYRVDDLKGKINGLAPGDAGYAAAAAARAYTTTSGGPLINGPGYGAYTQTELTGIDAGDVVAMALINNTHGNTYWGFAQANETVGGTSIAHLWNYGANTWGWEDTYGGGDRDYNDLTVGLDFISTSGHGLLV
jgi:hypothetical protein